MRGIKVKFLFVCALILFFSAAPISLGDWDPGDGHKMHWPQTPKPGGWDVSFDPAVRLADDWQCSQTGPVEDIHFWVSWEDDMVGPINGFSARIWSDDPCGANGYSEPNELLWERDFDIDDFTVRDMPDDLQGWFNPFLGFWIYPDHIMWQQINIEDINEPFIQQQGEIYWLEIDMWGANFCGWKESGSPQFRDDAVGWWSSQWNELTDPCTGLTMDLAFVITGGKPPVPHLKWSQPPIEMDPTADTPTFWGWDEPSFATEMGGFPLWFLVADDFRCLGTMPVKSLHWWGSYLGWFEPEPPVFEPLIGWSIGFWSNVPADPCIPYSRPEELLWQIEVDADRVDVDQVGTDEWCGYYPNDVAYQYYLDLEPNEVFWQDDFTADTNDNIFWLSIAALYEPDVVSVPANPWGWKTRPWSWMDDAVTFMYDEPLEPGITLDPRDLTPIEDPVYYESYDVAFELDTDPNWIKWEQPFTGIRHWPHYEDEMSMATGNNGEPDILRLVADDWLCDGNTPVNAIVWWGSYIGYSYNVGHIEEIPPPMPLPAKPDYFRLNIWTDVPADPPDEPYSHPNDIIWEYDAYDYDEVLVGYDKHPEGEPNEPVFRYSVRIPEEEWFLQDDANNNIYWLSVVAVYDQSVPNYDWGWTNHKHEFQDDAVEGYFDPPSGWFWYELYDQTGMSEDMSFILFTTGWPRCWAYSTQCHGDSDDNSTVDIVDWPFFRDGFGKTYPDPAYEPCADYNRDGTIDIVDWPEFRDNFGGIPAGGCPPGDINGVYK